MIKYVMSSAIVYTKTLSSVPEGHCQLLDWMDYQLEWRSERRRVRRERQEERRHNAGVRRSAERAGDLVFNALYVLRFFLMR